MCLLLLQFVYCLGFMVFTFFKFITIILHVKYVYTLQPVVKPVVQLAYETF